MKDLTLKELVALDFQTGFLPALYRQFSILYKLAYEEVYSNPGLGDPEAEYVLGHIRRGLCENKLRELAIQFGVAYEMVASGNGGCKHVQLIVGRFRFSMCHVQSHGSFPRYSYSREQYAKINQHMAQKTLFPVESEPREAELFGIIVHTESSNKSVFGFSGIGFPDTSFAGWVEAPIDLLDIIDSQAKSAQPQQNTIDKAEPMLKVRNQKQQNEKR